MASCQAEPRTIRTAAKFLGNTFRSINARIGHISKGLTTDDANEKRERYGSNALIHKKNASVLESFISQFKNPIILLLLFAAVLSLITGDYVDGSIIIVIVFISSILDLFQNLEQTRHWKS